MNLPIAFEEEMKALLGPEEYEEYLKVYQAGDKTETNGERGLKRKMSSLRSFYAYYYKHEFIQTNPTVLVDVPKTHEKSIIRLDADGEGSMDPERILL